MAGLDNPARASCRFRGKTYPFYPIAPGRMRALIGLTARDKSGLYVLEVKHDRFILPDQTRILEVDVKKRTFTHQHLTMPKKKTKLAGKPDAKTAIRLIRATLAQDSRRQYWDGPLLRPSTGRKSSSYGHTRTINKKMSWDWHKGIDIAAPEGHPVVAPAGGKVVLTGRFPVQGGTLILDHGQGLMSAFLHLKTFLAEQGQILPQGAPVAEVGGGGFSTGSHLHWGVYLHGAPVDPLPLLKRKL